MRTERLVYAAPSAVRGLPSRRANRIRFSWFTLGIISGVIISFLLGQQLAPTQESNKLVKSTTKLAAKPAPKLASAPRRAPVQAAPETKPTGQAKISYPLNLSLEVRRGDSLLSLLTGAGVSQSEAHAAIAEIKKSYNINRMTAGQTIQVVLDRDKKNPEAVIVSSLTITVSPLHSIKLARKKNDGFQVTKTTAPLEKRIARAGGVITNSLYETGAESGLSPALLGELINAYSYDVDFQRDIKNGDQLDVLFEKITTKDGYQAGTGNVIYASLDLGDRQLKLFRHVGKDGRGEYYNEKGESIRKALLKTPINGARISSGFGMRFHPIQGYNKMHKGVDFAAASGTPIYAAGDGVVEEADVKGAYGNYLKISHNNKYATAYAHISRFAPGIYEGKKVRQGQIVAYVGSTGRSTGPHLHYEVLANGAQVNPTSMKFKTGNSLSGRELASFKQGMRQIQSTLASLSREKEQVAFNQ